MQCNERPPDKNINVEEITPDDWVTVFMKLPDNRF